MRPAQLNGTRGVEVVGIHNLPLPDWLLDAEIVAAGPGGDGAPYAHTYSLAIEGRAVTRGGDLVAEVTHDGATIAAVPVRVPRTDSCEGHPNLPRPAFAGFQAVVGTVALPREFELTVAVVDPAGVRARIGRVAAHRRPLPQAPDGAIQPLLVTTLGRTGSTWLTLLLACHPAIIGYRPFHDDARLASYWTEVLRTLAEPASYMQAIRPELYPGTWWTGEQRPGVLPLEMAEESIAQWLGAEGVDAIAAFCQERIEAFYREALRREGGADRRYFVEKCWPNDATPRMVGELYPEAREIVLVRDFRDMVCSILAFNAKRGIAAFGREATATDEEFIHHLRSDAGQLLRSWNARRDHAHLLRYEDLIQAPEKVLGDALRYVGLAADAGTVRAMIAAARHHLVDTQRAHQTSPSPRASVGRWRSDLTPGQQAICREAFGDILAAFGYEVA